MAVAFLVPDQKYDQLVFVLLHQWAPTAHLKLLLSSSSLQKGRKRQRPKTVPKSQNAMADPEMYPNKGGSPCHQELS